MLKRVLIVFGCFFCMIVFFQNCHQTGFKPSASIAPSSLELPSANLDLDENQDPINSPPSAPPDVIHYNPSNSPFELEIIQPKPNLTTANRFYKTYPGLLYEVRAAVVGGAYPYRFTLNAGPSGMTINSHTGLIRWPNPIASATAYPIQLTVLDSANIQKTVSWTLSVTTEKFIFVDSVNGKVGATGTINDPVKSFVGVYGGTAYEHKYSTQNIDKFVYFKNGTYSLEGYTGGTQGIQYTNRHPLVLMAYPGHQPKIEMSQVAFRCIDTLCNNLYVEGFDIDTINTNAANEYRMGFRIGSGSSHVTFRKNKFHNMSHTTGSFNQSAIMISRDNHGQYWSIQDNEFYDIHGGYGIIGYSAQKVLIEDNYFHDMTATHPIGPKTSTSYWFIRHNKITNTTPYGIWLYNNENNYGNMEVSFNFISMSQGQALSFNESYNSNVAPIYVYRNTVIGDVEVHGNVSTVGPYYFSHNIFVNNQTNGIKCTACQTTSNINLNNNIATSSLNNSVVNSQGNLTLENINLLGIAGWQTHE